MLSFVAFLCILAGILLFCLVRPFMFRLGLFFLILAISLVFIEGTAAFRWGELTVHIPLAYIAAGSLAVGFVLFLAISFFSSFFHFTLGWRLKRKKALEDLIVWNLLAGESAGALQLDVKGGGMLLSGGHIAYINAFKDVFEGRYDNLNRFLNNSKKISLELKHKLIYRFFRAARADHQTLDPQGSPLDLEKIAQKILDKHPLDPSVLTFLVQTLLGRNHFEEAEKLLSQKIKKITAKLKKNPQKSYLLKIQTDLLALYEDLSCRFGVFLVQQQKPLEDITSLYLRHLKNVQSPKIAHALSRLNLGESHTKLLKHFEDLVKDTQIPALVPPLLRMMKKIHGENIKEPLQKWEAFMQSLGQPTKELFEAYFIIGAAQNDVFHFVSSAVLKDFKPLTESPLTRKAQAVLLAFYYEDYPAAFKNLLRDEEEEENS